MPDVHVKSRRSAPAPAPCSGGGRGAIRFGRVLLMIGGLCCCALSSLAQTSDSTTTDQHDSSTATTDSKSGDLLSTRIPVRIIESHSQDGNRSFDNRSVQIRGVDGHLVPYQEIERETVRVNAVTVQTTTRTFGRDVNGARSLIQITEEEKHDLGSGGWTVLRMTLNPDVNGKLQPVQREIVETRTISADVEETNRTVMLPNINGGLAPAFKTHEVRKRRADGTTESEKSTLLADGAGKWQLNETRQVTTTQDGANRASEERVFRRDAEGKLSEQSRVLSEESIHNSGEKRTTVETYSVDVPGATRDGKLHPVERVSTSSQSNESGGRAEEQKVEVLNPGDPGAGLRVSVVVNGKVVPVPPGKQSTVIIRARDVNGRFDTVYVNTTKSDPSPTIQIQQPSPEQPK